MRQIRRYEARLDHERQIAAAFRRILDAVGAARIQFFLEDQRAGQTACARIVEKLPGMARFLVAPLRPPAVSGRSAQLLNFDTFWDVNNPAAPGEDASREDLVAIAEGIPDQFPVVAAVFVIGPVAWTPQHESFELAGKPVTPGTPPFSTRFPALTYFSPGVIVQRLGTGKVSVTITEGIDPLDETSAATVQQLAHALGAGEARVLDVSHAQPKPQAPPPPGPGGAMVVNTRFREAYPRFIAEFAFPRELPRDLKPPHEPVGEVRAALVRAFKADSWKKSAGQGAGTHQLWKPTPNGRSLVMDFDTGSWLRALTGSIKLITEAGNFRLTLHADREMRGQYVTPNKQVFRDALENETVLVRHLETSWVAPIEEALGPVPSGYRPPEF